MDLQYALRARVCTGDNDGQLYLYPAFSPFNWNPEQAFAADERSLVPLECPSLADHKMPPRMDVGCVVTGELYCLCYHDDCDCVVQQLEAIIAINMQVYRVSFTVDSVLRKAVVDTIELLSSEMMLAEEVIGMVPGRGERFVTSWVSREGFTVLYIWSKVRGTVIRVRLDGVLGIESACFSLNGLWMALVSRGEGGDSSTLCVVSTTSGAVQLRRTILGETQSLCWGEHRSCIWAITRHGLMIYLDSFNIEDDRLSKRLGEWPYRCQHGSWVVNCSDKPYGNDAMMEEEDRSGSLIVAFPLFPIALQEGGSDGEDMNKVVRRCCCLRSWPNSASAAASKIKVPFGKTIDP